MAYTINAQNPKKAFLQALSSVQKDGAQIEDDGEQLSEILGVLLQVANPLDTNDLPQDEKLSEMITWMKANFLTDKPVDDWGYSYGQRAQNYQGINQIEGIVNKLKKKPEAKSATITFSYPPGDDKHMPCVISLDVKLRNEQLDGYAFFRSQDVGKKMIADIISIGTILDTIARQLTVKTGSLTIFIASLHMYLKDQKRVDEFVNLCSTNG